MSFGKPEAARSYLDRFVATTGSGTPRDLAEAYFLVGSELVFQKNLDEALVALRQAVALNPDSPRIRLELATLLFRTERFAEAVPHLRLAVQAEPLGHNTRKMLSLALIQSGDHADALRHLQYLHSLDERDAMAKLWYGHALVRVGRAPEAERLLREALHLQPDSLLILNELAWLLATHPDPGIQKPAEALALAGKAAQASGRREPRVLDTLAAAQAATGDFKAAVDTIDTAIALAEAAQAHAIRNQLETRRAGYLERKPHRESFAGGK
jgi:Flp pilus assembly protein TadD